jgi:hypothetical protein
MAESALATFCFNSMEGGKLARRRQKPSSLCVVETSGHQVELLLPRRNQTPCPDRLRIDAGARL